MWILELCHVMMSITSLTVNSEVKLVTENCLILSSKEIGYDAVELKLFKMLFPRTSDILWSRDTTNTMTLSIYSKYSMLNCQLHLRCGSQLYVET